MPDMKKILIIEDDQDLTNILKANIQAKRKFYEVIIAHDGQEGLDLFDANDIDLIILDIGLPKMGGIEVYKHLLKGGETTAIPILVFTARDELEGFFEQMEVAGFISKPFDTDVLIAEMDRVLKGKEKSFVYIVDDKIDTTLPKLVKTIKKSGYKVKVFNNIEECSTAIKNEQPYIVLLDYEQSQMSGEESIKTIKIKVNPKNTRIVVYTYSENPYKQSSIDAGANKYIGKPENVESIIKAIMEIQNKDNEDADFEKARDRIQK